MKVTKDQLHPDLQHTYGVMSKMPSILRFKPMLKLFDAASRRSSVGKAAEGLVREEYTVPSVDGAYDVRVVVFRPEGEHEALPAMLYIHGGGYIMGHPEQAVDIIRGFINARPCVVIAPDYRKAYTKPFPAGFDDCYATLLWARDNAQALGVRPERFMVAGHSAGGGLTAAVTLKVRDEDSVGIAFQMPIYPMIDDTQPDDPARAIDAPVWNTRMNRMGWGAYLADLHTAGEAIPPYAAPARNEDYRDFPPTITLVGDLEPFYRETGAYVEALRKAGVDVAYEEFEGCYHAFDLLGGKADISAQALKFTYDNFAAYFDKYVLS